MQETKDVQGSTFWDGHNTLHITSWDDGDEMNNYSCIITTPFVSLSTSIIPHTQSTFSCQHDVVVVQIC